MSHPDQDKNSEKPKKILYIITKSNFGGAQKYVFELATAAKGGGHNVLVACGGTGESKAKLGLLADKLNQINIPVLPIHNFMRDMSPLNDLRAFFEILKILKAEKPDVIHITSSKAGGVGALAGRLSGVPKIIFTSHGLTMDETWRPKWQQVLIYIATWLTIFMSHKSIMITSETYNRVKKMPGLSKKVELIFNGISDIDLLERSQARKALAPSVDPTAFWVGGIGELNTNKNWSLAIRSLFTLPPTTQLLIIGEGEDRPNLEKLIAKHRLEHRVHLLGYIDGAKYLKAFDIFVLSSLKEGLPYVLLEAGLSRRAVLATDLSGIRDIVTDKVSGRLSQPEETQFADALSALYVDKELRKKYGDQLHDNIVNKFSITKMIKDTFTLYQINYSSKITNSPPPTRLRV